MLHAEYKVFLDNASASRAQLDMIETVVVEQEVGVASEARIEIPICADEEGSWSGHNQDFMRGHGRLRVEVRIGDSGFRPLIDGPIVGHDTRMNSQPGQSSITLIVRDDSVYLNRVDEIQRFENRSDSEIASEIYGNYEQIVSTRIEPTTSSPDPREQDVAARGTHMRLLRELAHRCNMYAYVLPGSSPGQSMGVFAPYPTESDGLADLILTGGERNIDEFEISSNEESPCNVTAISLSISDKVVTSREASYRNVELMGDEPAADNENVPTCLLPPNATRGGDPEQRATAQAQRASFSIEARGVVRAGCYGDVLQPYRVVTVRGVTTDASGNYVITKVLHNLTRSEYRQEFELGRNARSGTPGDSLLEAIF